MATRGAYQTKQKEVIVDYFRAHPDACVTAEEIHAELGADVGMTTVYRAVTRLCEEGVLRRYMPQNAGGAALYQLNPCEGSHMHIRCVDCGEMEHLRCDVMNDFSRHLLGKHGFLLDEGKTMLYGRCEKCEEKRKAKKNPSKKEGSH